MAQFGNILFALGLAVWLIGEVRLLALAYRRSLAWFFGCLFVPFVGWAFFLLNVRQAWRPVLTATAGFVIAAIGYNLGGSQWWE